MSSPILTYFQLLIICTLYNFTHAIKGNDVEVANGDLSFIVSLTFSNFVRKKGHFCNGVLITKRLVLTATRCLEGKWQHQVRVLIGSNDRMSAMEYTISRWTTYGDWARRKNKNNSPDLNKVAIIELLSKVNNPMVMITGISPLRKSDVFGKPAIIAGWGSTGTIQYPEVMHKGSVTILSDEVCTERLGTESAHKFYIPETYLCSAGEPYTLLASRDVGGPILDERHYTIGINLYLANMKSPRESRINIHASIDFYREFIKDMMKLTICAKNN